MKERGLVMVAKAAKLWRKKHKKDDEAGAAEADAEGNTIEIEFQSGSWGI